MKQLNNKQRSALNAIRQFRGRFFGLYTTQGEAINSQFVSESPAYITVYDRNGGYERKLAKTSIQAVTLNG